MTEQFRCHVSLGASVAWQRSRESRVPVIAVAFVVVDVPVVGVIPFVRDARVIVVESDTLCHFTGWFEHGGSVAMSTAQLPTVNQPARRQLPSLRLPVQLLFQDPRLH